MDYILWMIRYLRRNNMHIVGFDLASFWLGFITGSFAFFIFVMIMAVRMNNKRKR